MSNGNYTNMKKVLLLLVALVGIALQSEAQMSLKVPKWEKFASITTEGVNLRKAPSTNSPKLYSKDNSWGHHSEFDYSWSPRSGYIPHRLEKGTILPVVKETDEWYCLFIDGFEDIYVMKIFCSLVTPIPITSDDYIQCGMEEVNGSSFLLGLYYFGSAVEDPYVRIGHKHGKFVVGADFGDDGVDFVNKFHDEELGYPNVEKVKAEDITQFLKSHKPLSTCDVWVKFPGQEYLNCYKYNADR